MALLTLGDKIVPAPALLRAVMERLDGWPTTRMTCDRYRQAEFEEALTAAQIRVPVVWRGQGFRDGGEDCERLRSAVVDGQMQARPYLPLRSAFADAVTLSDPAGT